MVRSTLLTLVLAAVLTFPAATATAAPEPSTPPTTPANPVKEMVECLTGPVIPEEFVYYSIWRCTGGQYVPEPVDAYTGCHLYFGLQVECYGGLSDLAYDLTGCRVGFPESTCRLDESRPVANPVRELIECLTAPYFPETSIYQVLWHCTAGQVAPEPVEHFTGCRPSSPPDLSCVPANVRDLHGVVTCILGPHFPETSIYQVLWYCTVGRSIPEPIEALTGCRPSSPPDLSCLGSVEVVHP